MNPDCKKKGYQGASILIHHTIISDVAYNLNKEDTKNGKTYELSLNLQGLVNNLVSGLVIAFEKPVNVGDVIEQAGKQEPRNPLGSEAVW
jgi:hypothetical protein